MKLVMKTREKGSSSTSLWYASFVLLQGAHQKLSPRPSSSAAFGLGAPTQPLGFPAHLDHMWNDKMRHVSVLSEGNLLENATARNSHRCTSQCIAIVQLIAQNQMETIGQKCIQKNQRSSFLPGCRWVEYSSLYMSEQVSSQSHVIYVS